MKTAVILLALNLQLAAVAAAPPKEPAPHCNIRVVSHKFVGDPATSFTYAGEEYTIPNTGWIELIAEKGADTYSYRGRELPLNVFPVDEFGTETIRIPRTVAFRAPYGDLPAATE